MKRALLLIFAISLCSVTYAYSAPKVSYGNNQPTTCNPANGDFWIDTNGTAGNRLYICTGTNTYTLNDGLASTKAPALGADDNYVTDSEKIKLSNLTGTNTGDQNAAGVSVADAGGYYTGTNVEAILQEIGLAGFGGGSVDLSAYLSKTNTTAFTPSGDYHPATKKYVDDSITAGGGAAAINDLTDVDTTGKATGKVLKFDASGNLVVGDDSTGSGSVPDGTVNGQVLLWLTDQWAASTPPWVTTASLGTGVATALAAAVDGTGGLASKAAIDALLSISAGTGITITEDGGGAGIDTIGVTANVYQAYDAHMIAWPSAISAIEVGYLDGLSEALSTSLAAKKSIADERKEIGWMIRDSDVVTAVVDGKQAAVIPANMNGMMLIDLICSVSALNGAASGETTVVLRRVRGATAVDMTSTGVTIAYTDYTALDEVVDTANDDVATGDKIFVDVTTVTSPAQKGLGCTAIFVNP